jgi:hypothetical protein
MKFDLLTISKFRKFECEHKQKIRIECEKKRCIIFHLFSKTRNHPSRFVHALFNQPSICVESTFNLCISYVAKIVVSYTLSYNQKLTLNFRTIQYHNGKNTIIDQPPPININQIYTPIAKPLNWSAKIGARWSE